MTEASSWAHVLTKVKVTWRALTMSRCPFEDYKPENEWFCHMYALCWSRWKSFAPIPNHLWRLWHILPIWNINTPIPMRLARIEESAQSMSMSHLALNFCSQVGAGARIWCRLHTPCSDCELACAPLPCCLHTPCTDCTVTCAHIYRNQDVAGRKEEGGRRSGTGRENLSLLPCRDSRM
jgi:hypothetical protein